MARVIDGEEFEVGYDEFDSSEFETDQSEDLEEKESEERAEPEVKETTDKESSEDAGEDPDEEKPESNTPEVSEKKPEYTPNLKFKVYDQEKEFPEWSKSLIKDEKIEAEFRTLFSKAEGLEEMKPRHQATIQERDEYKSELEWMRGDVNRIIGLREKSPELFFAELGVPDDLILKMASKIVDAKESPEAWERYQRNRQMMVDGYQKERQVESQQFDLNRQQFEVHQQAMSSALGSPEITSFQSQYDAVYGAGAFQEQVRQYGNYQYQATKRNISPYDAVKYVYEYHRKGFTQPQPQPVQTMPLQGATAAAPVRREAPPVIPNVGKGRNASPTKPKFKTIQQMRDYYEKMGS
jgi:hypothetical protein